MPFNLDVVQTIREQRLQQLQQQKQSLNSSEVQLFWEQTDKTRDQKQKFVSCRDTIKIACDNLENSLLQEIAEKLEANESVLKAACDDLQREIDSLNNAVAFLNTFSSVISIVGRIIPLAAVG